MTMKRARSLYRRYRKSIPLEECPVVPSFREWARVNMKPNFDVDDASPKLSEILL